MLLSFFIVLNSVSNFEDIKSRPVLNSLSIAFSNQQIIPQQTSALREGDDGDIHEGDTLESIEGLFKGHIAGFESRRNRFGTVMHTQLPISKFENAIDFGVVTQKSADAGEKGSFLQTMITLLRAEGREQTYRVDMVLQIPEAPAVYEKSNPSEYASAMKKVSGLAERMERNGLPTRMISVGLKKGNAGMIDIFIRPYVPFDLIDVLKKEKSEGEP